MSFRILLVMVLVFLTMLGASLSFADEGEEASASGFIFTPRAWFAFTDPVNESDDSTEAIFLPMYGGTLTVIPPFAPNWSVLFTGLHGTGDGDFVTQTTLVKGTVDMTRTDLELLFRYNFPGTKVFLMFGPRYVTVDTDKVSPAFTSQSDVYLLIGELGLGIVSDITEDGLNRLFGNFTIVVADFNVDFKNTLGTNVSFDNTEWGFDFNFGYQYWMTSNANVSVRYRGFFITQHNDFNQREFLPFHGPEVSFGWVF